MKELTVGQSVSVSKTIVESDVYNFAEIVGDFNYIHINKEKAKESVFGDRIAHGMLIAGLISSVIGTKLPGEGTIYMEQNLKFKAPVYFDNTVTVIVTVVQIIDKKRGIYKLETIVKNQNNIVVIEGSSIVKYA